MSESINVECLDAADRAGIVKTLRKAGRKDLIHMIVDDNCASCGKAIIRTKNHKPSTEYPLVYVCSICSGLDKESRAIAVAIRDETGIEPIIVTAIEEPKGNA